MGAIKGLVTAIQADLDDGKLSFAEIARKHEVPASWVEEVHQEMVEQEMAMDQYIMENDYMDDA